MRFMPISPPWRADTQTARYDPQTQSMDFQGTPKAPCHFRQLTVALRAGMPLCQAAWHDSFPLRFQSLWRWQNKCDCKASRFSTQKASHPGNQTAALCQKLPLYRSFSLCALPA
jgi:hypothetical protein